MCYLKHHSKLAHTYQDISILKIISPVRPDLPLSPNVPYIQLEALRLHTFNVKTLQQSK